MTIRRRKLIKIKPREVFFPPFQKTGRAGTSIWAIPDLALTYIPGWSNRPTYKICGLALHV
jgi:hypothetical protein